MGMSRTLAVVIGAALAVLLQVVVAPAMAIGGIVPNFLLAYALAVALARPHALGVVLPVVLGLLFDLLGGGPVGAMGLLLLLATLAVKRLYLMLDNDTLFIPLGLLVALGRMSKFAPLKWLGQADMSIMRGTPLMLQLIAIYFGPSLLFGMSLPRNWRMTATVVAFVLNYAAYFAEIYRGGILSMPLGQYEAAEVLGYSKTRTFLTIILPQVIKSILPAVTNEIIILVKDTSLAYAIGVVEMFTAAKQICVAPNSPGLLALLAAGVFYYVFNLVVAILMERVEKRLAYYR